MDVRLCNDDVQYWVIVTVILVAVFILGDNAVTTIVDTAAAFDVVTVVDGVLANNQVTKYINECI